jgi:hypothetical protein
VHSLGLKSAIVDSKHFDFAGASAAIAFQIALILTPPSGFAAPAFGGTEGALLASAQFALNIPAQPLANALEAFGKATGIETLYDSAVAQGRRSTFVKGRFTAADGLRLMLSGTSLSARAISHDAITIELPQESYPAAKAPAQEKSAHRNYFGLIQSGLTRAFCNEADIQPGDYRAVVKFSIAANGQVLQPSVVGTTGSSDRDRQILRALNAVSLGTSPPPDLKQPIMFVILPQSAGMVLDCASVQ